jgi:hypothetical protein
MPLSSDLATLLFSSPSKVMHHQKLVDALARVSVVEKAR